MILKFLKEIFDWSEVWATLIPLVVYLKYKPKTDWVKPLIVYLLTALLLAIVIDFTWKSPKLGLKEFSEQIFGWLYLEMNGKKRLFNVIFYNIGSFCRLLFITWFFTKVIPGFKKILFIVTILFITAVIVNFTIFEDLILTFSSRLFTFEAGIILFYCLLYYYTVNMNDEIISLTRLGSFWIVMGLTLYTSVNFLIFLFFKYLINTQQKYAMDIWNVHNAIYIILMIFIAIGFKKQKSVS
jgi:hypothetical protein